MVGNVNLMLDADTMFPAKGGVIAVAYRDNRWADAKDCLYTGVATPYVRDWAETRSGEFNSTTQEADLDKVLGYAIIINKKACPGKPDVAMFHGDVKDLLRWGSDYAKPVKLEGRVGGHWVVHAVPLAGKSEDQPKWLPGVLKTIEAAAPTNPAAKTFLDDVKAAAKLAEATKSTATP